MVCMGFLLFFLRVVWVGANQDCRVCEGLRVMEVACPCYSLIYRTHASDGIDKVTASLAYISYCYAIMEYPEL